MLASCSKTFTEKTARIEDAPYSMYNATVADLQVAPKRISYTLVPSKEIYNVGVENCKMAALNEALVANGSADLLLEPQYVISKKRSFWGKTIVTSVTVSGRPAFYTNFRSLNDSVWVNSVFRGTKPQIEAKKSSGSILGKILK